MKLFSTFKVTFFENGNYHKCKILNFKEEHGKGFKRPQLIFSNKGTSIAYDQETATQILDYWNSLSKGNAFFELMLFKKPNLIK